MSAESSLADCYSGLPCWAKVRTCTTNNHLELYGRVAAIAILLGTGFGFWVKFFPCPQNPTATGAYSDFLFK
ncbi:MAG: hypothetical protein ACYT04_08295 [Nostoc sp.]